MALRNVGAPSTNNQDVQQTLDRTAHAILILTAVIVVIAAVYFGGLFFVAL